jgi:elongation factor Ts
MAVTAEAVKTLRERTGAGMMECKKALVETNGDLDAAAEIMRKSGLAKADKKAGRVAAEGVVVVEQAADGHRAVVVEVNSETDFVAREKDFQGFAAEVARTALAAQPASLEALLATRMGSGKTVEETRRELIARIGENIGVRRFELISSDSPLAVYRHGTRIGVVVVLSGGDDVLGHDLAMHIAAINPQYLSVDRLTSSPGKGTSWPRRWRRTRKPPASQRKSSPRWSTARSASSWAKSPCWASRSSRMTSRRSATSSRRPTPESHASSDTR